MVDAAITATGSAPKVGLAPFDAFGRHAPDAAKYRRRLGQAPGLRDLAISLGCLSSRLWAFPITGLLHPTGAVRAHTQALRGLWRGSAATPEPLLRALAVSGSAKPSRRTGRKEVARDEPTSRGCSYRLFQTTMDPKRSTANLSEPLRYRTRPPRPTKLDPTKTSSVSAWSSAAAQTGRRVYGTLAELITSLEACISGSTRRCWSSTRWVSAGDARASSGRALGCGRKTSAHAESLAWSVQRGNCLLNYPGAPEQTGDPGVQNKLTVLVFIKAYGPEGPAKTC